MKRNGRVAFSLLLGALASASAHPGAVAAQEAQAVLDEKLSE